MKKKILVKAPVLSQSGYGEQARFALRALRSREDIFDIYIEPLNWGKTGWISLDNEERSWIDDKIRRGNYMKNNKAQFDISLQVTIPNEFENVANVNIGYTAGIETDKVAPVWLPKVNQMDKIIVVSNHAKDVFENTTYTGTHPQTGQEVQLSCDSDIAVVNYPVLPIEPENIDLNLDFDFNYLAISQWGPRKNFNNLINWFIEENKDEEVGLVLKTSIQNNSVMDRMATETKLKQIVSRHGDIKCRIYLLHGDLTPEQLSGLYSNKKIKCLISTAHGEGYGLPLFEAAYNGLPVIVHGWSGQRDFLYVPDGKRKGKTKPMFATVEYELGPVQKSAVWKGVITEDSQWAYPKEESLKSRLKEVREKYKSYKTKANKLKKHLVENFTEERMYEEFVSSIVSQEELESYSKEIDELFDSLGL